jgi:predicted acyltransferase
MVNENFGRDRLLSLDQFRGYTVLGMFFVNFTGHFQAIPDIFKHHNTYCSYADTIMPQFFFAVGFAYRMTFLRRLSQDGPASAYLKVLRRSLGLILIGVVIYHLDGGAKAWSELQSLGAWGFLTTAFQRNVFQTLVHIGVASLWVLPVMAAGSWGLILFACASAGLHLLLSHWFYYDWVMTRPGIDGGPLGFLTWTIPLLVGAVAYEIMVRATVGVGPARRLLAWGCVLMVAGYAISCQNLVTAPAGVSIGPQSVPRQANTRATWLIEPPFVPPSRPVNIWTMSQRAGSVSYLTFGAGFSLALFALFVWACDHQRIQMGLCRTLGSNALAAYILHDLVIEAMRPFTPKDSPLWYVLAAFALFLGITYLFVRYMERNRLYLRL